MIIKKGWFSELEILEIHQKINRQPRQDTNTITYIPNTEKQELSNCNDPQTNNNRNASHSNYIDQILTQEELNLENLKRIMYDQKTRLPSLRNQDWRTVKAETEKINKLLTHISMNYIIELNKLIYAGVKLVCEKNRGSQKNTNRN